VHRTQLEDEGLLLTASNEIWNLVRTAGRLTEWCASLSESMGMESATKQLRKSLNNLLNTRLSIAKALDGIEESLKDRLNGEEGEEREREREGR